MIPLWCCNCNRNQPLLTFYNRNRNRLQEIACNRTRNHRFVIDPMPDGRVMSLEEHYW